MTVQELKNIITNEEATFPEITEGQAMKAYICSLMQIKNKYDVFYFFASMNLLNAYVKKNNAGKEFAKKYKFKEYVIKGIEQITQNPIEGVTAYVNPEVSYVSVMGLQFSFHNLKATRGLRSYMDSNKNIQQQWKGIRLQPPAGLIFSCAEKMRNSKKGRV